MATGEKTAMNWQRFWQQRGLMNVVLLPISALFYVLSGLRRIAYQWGWRRVDHAERPVVVVGNLNVGGAGKTPLVIALGKLLAAHQIRYAVISKGYGGRYEQPTLVNEDDDANVVGDEPLLIKRRCGCPVVVAKSRIEAARLAIAQFPETQVLLTDDGLQHYQLARDVEICVINHHVGLGNGWVLPAGGLREPPSRLNHVDFVVNNGNSEKRYHYMLAERGWWHIHKAEQRYPDEFADDSEQNLVLSGIAHPEQFFARVKSHGIAASYRALPDHHPFKEADLPADKTLLMTEKDWVKAKNYNHVDAWYLATEAVLSEQLQQDFLKIIQRVIDNYD